MPLRADLALLGGGELGRVLALDQLDRTAGLLDRLARALRHAGDLEAELGLQFALAEQADAVLAAAARPAALSASWSSVPLMSSLPASIAFWIAPMFTSA